jgi:hypothetical protein
MNFFQHCFICRPSDTGYHFVRGCWDRTEDFCELRFWHWPSDARLDLIPALICYCGCVCRREGGGRAGSLGPPQSGSHSSDPEEGGGGAGGGGAAVAHSPREPSAHSPRDLHSREPGTTEPTPRISELHISISKFPSLILSF